MSAYTELVDFTFTANETSRTFSGLSITKDDFVKVVMTHVTPSNVSSVIRIFPNTAAGVSGHDTTTNYHRQSLFGEGSSVFAGRSNENQFNFTNTNTNNLAIGYIKISENGKYNSFVNHNIENTSSLRNLFLYCTSSNLTFNDSITSLTFDAATTNGLGTGSRIQIYKLDAVKEADITVTSNTTQVDISNLSIDKDSEYLLTWTVDSTTTTGTAYHLTPNDLTTLTGYHRQEVFGAASTAGAGRANNARFAETSTPHRISTGYAHIKLSNIGAYTFQGYDLLGSGATTPIISNGFVSSTAENITSITKLNIISSVTNNIKAGSRFTLYKLYE